MNDFSHVDWFLIYKNFENEKFCTSLRAKSRGDNEFKIKFEDINVIIFPM